ncbi:MAG: hypothetical protein C0600_01510 [Ignavibacteria bacterium]|nr:MAG: hypothetical protein C0600_01510 [Ignavibacteria bacterium]
MRRSLLLFLLFAFLPLASCDDDDSGTDPVQTFSLLITNKTPNDYHLYQSPSDAGSGFAKTGFVLSNVNYRVNPLTAGVTYTFRLVTDGKTVDDFDYEKEVSSDGDEQTWVVY